MIKKIAIGVLIVVGVLLLLAHTSSLKNIDLSWNIKHLSMYEDCNGIVCQDAIDMYNRSFMYMFMIEPILISIYLVSVFWVITWKN